MGDLIKPHAQTRCFFLKYKRGYGRYCDLFEESIGAVREEFEDGYVLMDHYTISSLILAKVTINFVRAPLYYTECWLKGYSERRFSCLIDPLTDTAYTK